MCTGELSPGVLESYRKASILILGLKKNKPKSLSRFNWVNGLIFVFTSAWFFFLAKVFPVVPTEVLYFLALSLPEH